MHHKAVPGLRSPDPVVGRQFPLPRGRGRLAGLLCFCFALLLPVINASAEEGGSGHYFPGSMSTFIDGIPAEETIVFRLNLLDYSGNFDSDVAAPIAGLTALDVEVDSVALGFTGLWRPPVDLGERWSYAAAITVPFVDIEVEADVAVANDPLEAGIPACEGRGLRFRRGWKGPDYRGLAPPGALVYSCCRAADLNTR